MENLAGVIKFTADYMASEEEKPYIPVAADVSLKALSEFILDRWRMKAPDVMISIVTGVFQFKHWPDDYTIAFQSGLTKVMNTSNAWLLTHGFHSGVVKLLGEAVRDEQDKRTVYKSKTVRRYNKKISEITLIGITTDSLVNELEAFRTGDTGSGRRRVELDLAGEKPARQKYNLDLYHTHFVIVNGSTAKTITTFRTDLEKELQKFSSCRKNFGNGVAENSSDDEDAHSVIPSRPPTAESTTARMGVPLVALMIQGGPNEIQQIWQYLKNRTPVVVVKGSGLVADLFAYVYEEVSFSGDLEKDLLTITPDVIKRLEAMFPRLKQADHEEKMECSTKLLDCMRLSFQDDLNYVTLLDLTRASSDLADLDLHILRAIFSSQKARELDWKEQMKRDIILTLQWNRPDFAREEIMQRITKVKVDKDIFRLSLMMENREDFVDLILHHGFKTHKYLSHKALIDLFCYAEDTEFFSVNVLVNLLGYPPGNMVGERFLLEDLNWIIATFTRVEGFINSYELSTNSCGIYSTEPSVAERKSLNALIVWSILMGRHELTKVFWKYVEDPIPTAVFVSAMWNGLSNFCREPELEDQIRIWGKDFGVMGMDVLGMAYKESLDRTFHLLDREFPDFGRRTPVQLAYDARNRWFLAHPCCQKWINKLYMGHIQIASPHPGSPHVPDFIKILLSAFFVFPMFFWIHFPSLDSMEVRRSLENQSGRKTKQHKIPCAPDDPSREKLLRSSFLVTHHEPTTGESLSAMGSSKSLSADDSKRTWLMQLQDHQQKARKGEARRRFFRRLFFGNLTGSQNQFSLMDRIYLMWTAPITKFWTFQFFYWLYLLLFSVVTLMPVCSHQLKHLLKPKDGMINSTFYPSTDNPDTMAIMLDVILWLWTGLITAETFYRNYQLMNMRQFSHTFAKLMEMIFMVSFLAAYFMQPGYLSVKALFGLKADRPSTSFRVCSILVAIVSSDTMVLLYRKMWDPNITCGVAVRVLGQQPELVDAFTARSLMCIGLLYFSYRLIGIFFPISDTLGPMLVRIKFMIGEDFVNYMKLIAPFLLAGGVTTQAILFPDMNLTWEVLRMTFHRAFFSLFLAQPIIELGYTPQCEAKRLTKEQKDYCHAGNYADPECATVGFWSYVIVIQFMVILKLVLATLLYALFTATQLRIESEADAIWKFKRYSVVTEFASRPAIPPPFSMFHYIVHGARFVMREARRKFCRHRSPARSLSSQLKGRRSFRHDDFHYWKGLVREYFREEEKKKREAATAQRTMDKLMQIHESLNFQTSSLKHLKERLGDLETTVARITPVPVTGTASPFPLG